MFAIFYGILLPDNLYRIGFEVLIRRNNSKIFCDCLSN